MGSLNFSERAHPQVALTFQKGPAEDICTLFLFGEVSNHQTDIAFALASYFDFQDVSSLGIQRICGEEEKSSQMSRWELSLLTRSSWDCSIL